MYIKPLSHILLPPLAPFSYFYPCTMYKTAYVLTRYFAKLIRLAPSVEHPARLPIVGPE